MRASLFKLDEQYDLSSMVLVTRLPEALSLSGLRLLGCLHTMSGAKRRGAAGSIAERSGEVFTCKRSGAARFIN